MLGGLSPGFCMGGEGGVLELCWGLVTRTVLLLLLLLCFFFVVVVCVWGGVLCWGGLPPRLFGEGEVHGLCLWGWGGGCHKDFLCCCVCVWCWGGGGVSATRTLCVG